MILIKPPNLEYSFFNKSFNLFFVSLSACVISQHHIGGAWQRLIRENSDSTSSELQQLAKVVLTFRRVSNYSVAAVLKLHDEMEQLVAPFSFKDETWTVVSNASSRLANLLLQHGAAELAAVLIRAADPSAAKQLLSEMFPVQPSQNVPVLARMVGAVTAVVSSGLSFDLDTSKIAESPESLASHAKVFASASSFDAVCLETVSPELASKVTSYCEAYVQSVDKVLAGDSTFMQSFQSFKSRVDKYRRA